MKNMYNNSFLKKIGRSMSKVPIKGQNLVLFVILIFEIIMFAFITSGGRFLRFNTLKTISIQLGITGLVALGEALVILTGNIDLSVGSMVGLTSVFAALIFSVPYFTSGIFPAILSVVIILFIGAILGAINSSFIVGLGINSIIVTLGTMAIFRGICYLLLSGEALYIENGVFLEIGRWKLGNIVSGPFLFILFLVSVLFILLRYTKLGKHLKAVGANKKTSFVFGISVKRIKTLTLILSGICAAGATIILSAQIGAGMPTYGKFMEVEAIIIAVLGGYSLSGGKGNAIGFIIALLLLEIFRTGLVMNGISHYVMRIVRGVLLIAVLAFDVYKRKKQSS